MSRAFANGDGSFLVIQTTSKKREMRLSGIHAPAEVTRAVFITVELFPSFQEQERRNAETSRAHLAQ